MSLKSARREEEGSDGISEEEKKRYDRQIRVWGSEAQHRIQTSSVLICGLKGLNIEVVKNIVLAGMNVVLIDSSKVEITNLSCNFFLSVDDVGRPTADACLDRIQELNNFAKVSVESKELDSLADDFFEKFSVISMGGASESECLRVSEICRKNKSTQFASWAFGCEGAFISDFGETFEYKKDPVTGANQVQEVMSVHFPSLMETIKRRWSTIQKGKFLPIPKTYVKALLLSKYEKNLKNLKSNNSSSSSSSSSSSRISSLAMAEFASHGLEKDFLSAEEIESLQEQAEESAISISVVSVLGR